MRNRTKTFSVMLLLFSVIFLKAQQTETLTLDEAIQLGIKNSKYLKIDATKIEEANANLLQAKNNKLPSLSVSGSAMYLSDVKVDMKLGQNAGASSFPNVNSVFYGNLSASMPLFTGGRIKYGIKSSEYLLEATKLIAENDKLAIAYNISEAYNNLFKANKAIKVLQENLKASQKRDETFLNLEKNGVIARNDRLKAQLQTNNIELELLDAQNNYKIANINMDLLLGLPEETVIEVDSNYINDILEDQALSYFLTEAFQNRKDLQVIDYQRKAAELGVKVAKAENYPTIALTGGYIAADIPNVFSIYNAANVGIGVKYNLDNLWKKNSSLIKTQAKEKELSAQNDLLNDQIKLQVNRDYQNAQLAKKKIEVYQKALEQATENNRIVVNKYKNGLANITDLLDANAAQISANVNVINSKADAALAYKKLLQTTGILNTNL